MNRLIFLCCAASLFFMAFFHAAAQEFPTLHYTVENGLPGNNVYSVYSDSRGFVWIATDKGVARYNGVKFEVFSNLDGLPDNEIFFFKEDLNGRLWLGTFNGAFCYYKDGVFHSEANTPFLKMPVQVTHAKHIAVEKDSSLIVSFSDNEKFVVIQNERCKLFDLRKMNRPDLLSMVIFSRKISDNRYKLICSDRLVYIDTLYHVLEEHSLSDSFKNDLKVFSYCQDQDYFYNSRYIYTWDMSVVRPIAEKFTRKYFVNQFFADKGNFYFATVNGLFIGDSVEILKGNNVSAITRDCRNNYWVSTLNAGVFLLKHDFVSSQFYKDVYKGAARYAFAYPDKLFFATTDNSLFELKEGGAKCIFNYAAYRREPYDYTIDFGFLADSNYRYYNIYQNDYTVIKDLNVPRPEIRYVRRFGGTKEIIMSGGMLYLRLPYGITRIKDVAALDKGKLDEQYIGHVPPGQNRVFCMAKAPDQSVWYSRIDGIYKVRNSDSEGVLQRQLAHIAFKYFSIFSNFLIGYTHANQLLICSNYDSDHPGVDSVQPVGNCVWDKLYRMDSTNILASTNGRYMLIRVWEDEGRVKHSVHAIENPFVPLHAEVITSDGENWYFFKSGSVTAVSSQSLLGVPPPPKLTFETIKTWNGKVYSIGQRIEVSYSEARNVHINFATLSYGTGSVRYQYSLSKNGEDRWAEVGSNGIDLARPAFGEYVVKVKAKTISSEYSEPVVFTLDIRRPYWATWWFALLVAVFVLLVVGIIMRFRILQVLHKKEKEHDTEIKFMKSEYKTLNALMNPHFIFNTLNNVQGLINRNDKLAANEYIRVFADLIRQNMHNISKDLISLQKEMDLVNNYLLLEKLRFKEHLNYSIKIDEAIDLSEIMIPPLLVQPLVENSIKHGILPLESQEGFILIHVYERNGILFVDVKDNGVGMQTSQNEKDALHESIGLENVRKRIKQLSIIQNKEISFRISETRDENGKLQWTVVSIGIPVAW